MKWARRLLLLVGFILLGIIVFCLVGIYLYRGTPSWYRRRIATTQQVRDAANSADQKLIDLFSWAASAHAQDLRRVRGVAAASSQPIGPKTVSFSEDELNSFLNSWQPPRNIGLQERMSRYFKDGRVVFQPDAIILAGQSPTIDALVSAEFNPSIDSRGNLGVSLGALRAGLLPLPKSALAGQFQRLDSILQEQLEDQQQQASIDPALTANESALAASWLRLLLSGLRDSPADSFLIIPFDLTHFNRGLPVKVTAIKVGDGEISLTIYPIPLEQRDALIDRLKQPLRAQR